MKGKCEDIFAYRNVDRGRTYGPEDRCCLFLTGPVWAAVWDGEIFIRSSKVVIVYLKVEDARNERKEKEGTTRGGRGRRSRVGTSRVRISVAIPCQLVTVTSPTNIPAAKSLVRPSDLSHISAPSRPHPKNRNPTVDFLLPRWLRRIQKLNLWRVSCVPPE